MVGRRLEYIPHQGQRPRFTKGNIEIPLSGVVGVVLGKGKDASIYVVDVGEYDVGVFG